MGITIESSALPGFNPVKLSKDGAVKEDRGVTQSAQYSRLAPTRIDTTTKDVFLSGGLNNNQEVAKINLETGAVSNASGLPVLDQQGNQVFLNAKSLKALQQITQKELPSEYARAQVR